MLERVCPLQVLECLISLSVLAVLLAANLCRLVNRLTRARARI